MKLQVLLYVLIFITGFLSYYTISSLLSLNLEQPFSASYEEERAPGETVQREDIQVYDDKIIINIDNAGLGKYAATGSMLPVLNENTKGIRIVPESEENINIGDIVSYNKNGELIIHRVVEKGEDNDGTYFVLKGDNNSYNDGKIRFSQIVYKTIGVIW